MLLWAGLVSILLGIAALAIDRPLAHFIYDHVNARVHKALDGITHYAKAGHWLAAAILALIVAAVMRHFDLLKEDTELLVNYSVAFIASLTMGSAVLHVIKLVLGRRRPRDDMEMGLYGFMPLAFNPDYNSFPSGHALTICCVAVIFTCVWPLWWPVWFAVAAILAVTRALLTAHFLSDVLIGAGIGLIAAREVLLLGFPGSAPGWY
ncbi:MAG TPA: phosphatase PAP2 family protein [Rhizomicrobium sp.]|jgi:membrane-associated phospholipid phosphatase|nr:phosphatase PAP2 family protein [Rhizomicrobium sp.]